MKLRSMVSPYFVCRVTVVAAAVLVVGGCALDRSPAELVWVPPAPEVYCDMGILRLTWSMRCDDELSRWRR